MSIVLSCGHRVDDLDEGYDVIIKTYDRTHTNAVAFMTVCALCKTVYEREGITFDNYSDAMEWVRDEELHQ